MAMTTGPGNGPLSDINVTPLVDVMLVLLIIFMVTAPMMTAGVDVNLPQARGGALPDQQPPIILTITQQGDLYLNDQQTSLARLAQDFGQERQQRGAAPVFLKADRQVPYGVVVQVMAILKAQGVDKLGMITESPD